MSGSDASPPVKRRTAVVPLVGALLVGLLVGLAVPHPWRLGGGVLAATSGRATEEGTAVVPPVLTCPDGIDVYYAAPFASPPRLEFPDGLGQCVVVEQSAARFKLKGVPNWSFEEKVRWKAEGQPIK